MGADEGTALNTEVYHYLGSPVTTDLYSYAA
jgi:hypothetical protein